MDLLRMRDERVKVIASARAKLMLEAVDGAIEALLANEGLYAEMEIITRPKFTPTCHDKFSCVDERGDYYSRACPYGVNHRDCVIRAVDFRSEVSLLKGKRPMPVDEAQMEDLEHIAFMYNLYASRLSQGYPTEESVSGLTGLSCYYF